jgi:hypothetical protein
MMNFFLYTVNKKRIKLFSIMFRSMLQSSVNKKHRMTDKGLGAHVFRICTSEAYESSYILAIGNIWVIHSTHHIQNVQTLYH